MTRWIQQQNRSAPKKEKKPSRTLPKTGKYTVKDLSAKGVKSGVWEKKDGD